MPRSGPGKVHECMANGKCQEHSAAARTDREPNGNLAPAIVGAATPLTAHSCYISRLSSPTSCRTTMFLHD